ncbi:MAG: hypothetical protein AB7O47_04720 [Flavobacteriales bacterium]
MRILIIILFVNIFFACQNNQTTESELTIIPDSTQVTFTDSISILDSNFYPSYYVRDSSWKVALDIQEGFLLNFTISYKNKISISKNIENEMPPVGGVDYPEPHYINDTTFYIPNLGASENGYYEMFIYKNGERKYQEIITKK